MAEVDLSHLQHWLEQRFSNLERRLDQRFAQLERHLLVMDGALHDVLLERTTLGDIQAVHTRLIDIEERLSRLEAAK